MSTPTLTQRELETTANVGTARKRERRGLAGFRKTVRLRQDGQCSIARHFGGCLRQIIGYAVLLAERDPERFIWPSRADWQQHARNFAAGGKQYHADTVDLNLAIAESLGVLTTAKKFRRGSQRRGWVVATEEILGAMKDEKSCTLAVEIQATRACRKPGERRWKSSRSAVGSQIQPDGESDSNRGGSQIPSQIGSQIPEPSESDSNVRQVHTESGHYEDSRSESDGPSHRSHRSHLYDEPSAKVIEPSQTAASSDLPSDTKNQTACDDQKPDDASLTVRDVIGSRFRYASGKEEFEKLADACSGGRFHIRALKHYEHTRELGECCREVIDTFLSDLGGEPWKEKMTEATMGAVMDLMHERFGVNVPPGWYRELKKLRGEKPQSGGES